MKCKALITKIKNKQTGLLRIPEQKLKFFVKGRKVEVTIIISKCEVQFMGEVIKCGVLGIYVPKELMIGYRLNGNHTVDIRKSNKILLKMGKEGRLYLPNTIPKKLGLRKNEIVKMTLSIKGVNKIFFPRIKKYEKEKTVEYLVFLPKELFGKEIFLKGIKQLQRKDDYLREELKNVLKGCSFAQINKQRIIVYKGNRVPIVIKSNINYDKIAYYLGCFFADGTKRGNSWGMCASTFEQGKYFLKMHNYMVLDCKIRTSLSITLNKNDKNMIPSSIRLWNKISGVKINKKNVRMFFSDSKIPTNRNKFGTLVIKEHRQLVQIYYNALIKQLLKTIRKEKRTDLAQKFICGVLEGDGCLNARDRDHIQITSNDDEVEILEKFLESSALEFKAHKEKATGKVYINIGGLSIKENLDELNDLLFKYYPKRRKIMKERMLKTATTRFLIGKQPSTSYWILKRFRKKRILDEKNKLTTKGRKIRKALKCLEKEIIPLP